MFHYFEFYFHEYMQFKFTRTADRMLLTGERLKFENTGNVSAFELIRCTV